MYARIRRFVRNKSGATAIEYGLIAALVAVAIISGLSVLGTNLNSTFTTVAGHFGSGSGGSSGSTGG